MVTLIFFNSIHLNNCHHIIQLGVIPKGLQSEATCSHAYVKGSSHTWTEADGVMIFNKSVLPGYSALFRHYNDDMYLGKWHIYIYTVL